MNWHCKSRTRGGATSVADEFYWSLRCKEKALREEEEHQKQEQVKAQEEEAGYRLRNIISSKQDSFK